MIDFDSDLKVPVSNNGSGLPIEQDSEFGVDQDLQSPLGKSKERRGSLLPSTNEDI